MTQLKDMNVIQTCQIRGGFTLAYKMLCQSVGNVIRTLAAANPDEDLDIYAGKDFSGYFLPSSNPPVKHGCPRVGRHAVRFTRPGEIDMLKIFNIYHDKELPRTWSSSRRRAAGKARSSSHERTQGHKRYRDVRSS